MVKNWPKLKADSKGPDNVFCQDLAKESLALKRDKSYHWMEVPTWTIVNTLTSSSFFFFWYFVFFAKIAFFRLIHTTLTFIATMEWMLNYMSITPSLGNGSCVCAFWVFAAWITWTPISPITQYTILWIEIKCVDIRVTYAL